jgi:hypothetical protein
MEDWVATLGWRLGNLLKRVSSVWVLQVHCPYMVCTIGMADNGFTLEKTTLAIGIWQRLRIPTWVKRIPPSPTHSSAVAILILIHALFINIGRAHLTNQFNATFIVSVCHASPLRWEGLIA